MNNNAHTHASENYNHTAKPKLNYFISIFIRFWRSNSQLLFFNNGINFGQPCLNNE